MKNLWLILLLTFSIFLCGENPFPSVQLTRYLGAGGTQKIAIDCKNDRAAAEGISCWLALKQGGIELTRKHLSLPEVGEYLTPFFQRVSHPKKNSLARSPAQSHIAFRWNISNGRQSASGEIAYGDGTDNDPADAALSVEFLLQAKLLEN